MAPRSPISLLDDDKLTRILELAACDAPTAVGPTLCLTCKRWRGLFYSSPTLWRAFTLAPPPDRQAFPPSRLAAQLGLLTRVAPVVESFQCDHCAAIDLASSSSGGGLSLLHFLRLLQPGVTSAVGLARLPCNAAAAATGPALVRQLLRLPHLTRLELSQAGTAQPADAGLPAGTPALLLCLPALQSVALETELPLPAGSLQAITQLGQLTALRLQARPLPDLDPLTSLQCLRRLAAVDFCSWLEPSEEEQQLPLLVPPPPAAFRPGLQEMACSSISRGLQFGGARLRSLAFSQLEGQQAASVRLEGLDEAAALAPVLHALLPPSSGLVLQQLHIQGRPQPEALLGCGQWLHSLQVLHLELTCCPQGHAVVEALLQQARALRELQLRMCFLGTPECGQLPPALRARGGLRALRLPRMCLEELPAGAYLLDLEDLECPDNSFKCVPPALASATRLQRLTLSNSLETYSPYNDEINLNVTPADVEQVFARLTALRRLDLGYSHCPPAVLAQLRAVAPQLEVAVQPMPEAYRQDVAIRYKMEEEDRRQRVLAGREAPGPFDDLWLDDARQAAAIWRGARSGGFWSVEEDEEDERWWDD